MPPFHGRKKELNILKERLDKKNASLVVIKGRRRIGKSRLLLEFGKPHRTLTFSGLPPSDKLTAQQEREDFAGQLSRELNMPAPRADDWGSLLWHLADQTKKGRVIIVLDEINWIGSKDPTFLGKLKNAWDLHFSKNPKLVLILNGSLTGWIERNIMSSTGFLGRVSLDLTLGELPLHECSLFWGAASHRISAYEKFMFLSVTGGVPRYLEEILPKDSAEENIRRLCFRKEGLLFNEFDRIFSDLFSRRNAIYRRIVGTLTDGSRSIDEISQSVGRDKSGVLSEYLDDLELAGFLTRDYTWKIKDGSQSKFSRFRISDNYLRFYLKYIQPNSAKIRRGTLIRLPSFDGVMGLQFENLVLNNRNLIHKTLNMDVNNIVNDSPFFQRSTTRQKGCQVDYMIQTKRNTLYVFEIKFKKSPLQKSVIEEVKRKIQSISVPKNFSFRPVLVHVNGVSDAVKEADFFDHIIDFGSLLSP